MSSAKASCSGRWVRQRTKKSCTFWSLKGGRGRRSPWKNGWRRWSCDLMQKRVSWSPKNGIQKKTTIVEHHHHHHHRLPAPALVVLKPRRGRQRSHKKQGLNCLP